SPPLPHRRALGILGSLALGLFIDLELGGVVRYVAEFLARWALVVGLGDRSLRDLWQLALDAVVRDGIQEVGDDVHAGAFLVLALHRVPGGRWNIRVDEHGVLGAGVVFPASDGLQVHRGKLPATQRILEARGEARVLLLVRDREPVLTQDDAVLDEQALEDRGLVQEATVLIGGAEAHDALHPSAGVPRAVEAYDLTGGGKLLDVALEVPLALLALGRRRQCLDAAGARVEVLGNA